MNKNDKASMKQLHALHCYWHKISVFPYYASHTSNYDKVLSRLSVHRLEGCRFQMHLTNTGFKPMTSRWWILCLYPWLMEAVSCILILPSVCPIIHTPANF